uniref:Ig-like domain-containing protein n=1 Tax=Amphiprion ocellaris TaxID=80972 RepID=A0A3Q1CV76_AMPOC
MIVSVVVNESFSFFLFSGCTDSHTFVRKTVGVGQSVNLTCTRQASLHGQTLYWIRLVSGKYPEFLGGTFSFDYDGINETPHITAKQEPEAFILYIHETQLSDTGFYYCIKVNEPYMEFMNATFLRIKEPDIIDIIQVPPSDPEHPGDSVSLQCSVLSDSEKKTCPEQQDRMFWFRAGSDESHPRLIYKRSDTQKSCVYHSSKTFNSSDAGTYYCAVATCGQILFGNGTTLINQVKINNHLIRGGITYHLLFLIFHFQCFLLFIVFQDSACGQSVQFLFCCASS